MITDDHANILELSFGHDDNAFLLGDGVIAIYAEPINVGIVASKQSLLEKIYIHAMRSLGKILTGVEMMKKNQGFPSSTALDCPSNSRVWHEGSFENVLIEPTCDDSYLAIGAALHL